MTTPERPGLCLSRDEVRELARTPVKARQVQFLARNGIRHYLDAHGWPVVLRSAVEGSGDQAQAAKPWKPHLAA